MRAPSKQQKIKQPQKVASADAAPKIQTKPSRAFLGWMAQGWGSRPQEPFVQAAAAQRPPLDLLRQRRAKLAAAFAGSAVAFSSGQAPVRLNDTHHRFRTLSDFLYLTGCPLPGALLVVWSEGKTAAAQLFVRSFQGYEDGQFFTDRDHGALWVGPQPTLAEVQAAFGIPCADLSQLPAFMAQLAARKVELIAADAGAKALRGKAKLASAAQSAAVAAHLAQQRLIKAPFEIAQLKKAARWTQQAMAAAIAALPKARFEYEIEAVLTAQARQRNGDLGYSPIVAAGSHACVLHWTRHDGRLRGRDLLLLDMGLEVPSGYTADITRTLPINGTFGRAARAVYGWVLAAHKAALQAAKPGAPFLAPHWAAMGVLEQGLVALGILKPSQLPPVDQKMPYYKRYTLHGVSHMLGLEVHDCSAAPATAYRYGKLQPGMVLTIEPGLYFQPHDLTVPKALRGIGVRIEDDVLITNTGAQILSPVPREIAAVEAWMRSIWRPV